MPPASPRALSIYNRSDGARRRRRPHLDIEVDLLNEIVLLVDRDLHVRDAFQAVGRTRHHTPYPVVAYTYRRLLTAPGTCAVCGISPDALARPCTASGGFHAFAGMADDPSVPDGHKVEARSLQLHALTYDEFTFFVEADNLFPLEGADPAQTADAPFAV